MSSIDTSTPTLYHSSAIHGEDSTLSEPLLWDLFGGIDDIGLLDSLDDFLISHKKQVEVEPQSPDYFGTNVSLPWINSLSSAPSDDLLHVETPRTKIEGCTDAAVEHERRSRRGQSLARSVAAFSEASSSGSEFSCTDCSECFDRRSELEEHARIEGHKPFKCRQCNQSFSRRDARTRHKHLHQAEGSHPCPHCPKYRGKTAFKRKDHLKKHLLKVHKNIDFPRRCPVANCCLSAPHGPFKQFERRKDFARHMREDHTEYAYDRATDAWELIRGDN